MLIFVVTDKSSHESIPGCNCFYLSFHLLIHSKSSFLYNWMNGQLILIQPLEIDHSNFIFLLMYSTREFNPYTFCFESEKFRIYPTREFRISPEAFYFEKLSRDSNPRPPGSCCRSIWLLYRLTTVRGPLPKIEVCDSTWRELCVESFLLDRSHLLVDCVWSFCFLEQMRGCLGQVGQSWRDSGQARARSARQNWGLENWHGPVGIDPPLLESQPQAGPTQGSKQVSC